MCPAFQRAFIKTNLVEHGQDRLRMFRVSVVRAASYGNLLCRELKARGRAGGDERNRLQWFGGRAQVSDPFRRTELCHHLPVTFNDHDVTVMARLADVATPDLD